MWKFAFGSFLSTTIDLKTIIKGNIQYFKLQIKLTNFIRKILNIRESYVNKNG